MGAHDADRVIDKQGFRPNVGIVVTNNQGQVLWGRRVGGRDSWQFPQGGIHRDESPEEAMYRELDEEIGLGRGDVKLVAQSKGWLRYRLPAKYIRKHEQPVCIGQKQRWFLLRLLSGDDAVRVDAHADPEFSGWRWVSYWYPVTAVVDFKQSVYRRALAELAPHLGNSARPKRRRKSHD